MFWRTSIIFALALLGILWLSPLSAKALSAESFSAQTLPTPEEQIETGTNESIFLRSPLIASGGVASLGDLFHGLSASLADRKVLRAPQPGREIELSGKWLNAIALRYKINWRADSSRIFLLESGLSRVPEEAIRERILQSLQEQGLNPSHPVQFDQRMPTLYVRDFAEDFSISAPRITGRRFTLRLEATRDDIRPRRVRIAGTIQELVSIPVLSTHIPSGRTIRASDLVRRKVMRQDIPTGALTDESLIVGLVATRPMQEGSPVQGRYLRRAILVKRRSMVQIELYMPNMRLSTRGRALEDGSMGDSVRVTNTNTNFELLAEVVAPGKVRVHPPGLLR